MSANNITFRKKKKITRKAMVVITVLVLVLALILTIAVSIGKKKKEEKANRVNGGTFVSDGFEEIADVSCLNETILTYTNAEGKIGLMRLDGTITEEAKHNKIFVGSGEWRNYRYICETDSSQYRLLVDIQSGTVSSKQYHGDTTPEEIPCWSEKAKALVWMDRQGNETKLKSKDLSLDKGLYPVSVSRKKDTKFGYIDEDLVLDIAPIYENALDFSEGLAAVKADNKWGYINESGVTIITPAYDNISGNNALSFKNGLAPVKKDGLCGLIDKNGNTVVDFVFESIMQGENGKYVAKRNGMWGVLTVDETVFAEVNKTEAPEPTTQGLTAPTGTYKITTSGSILNMRASASSDADVVAKIPNGTKIVVTESVPGWAYTTYGNYKGWISSDYIEAYSEPTTHGETTVITSTTGEAV